MRDTLTVANVLEDHRVPCMQRVDDEVIVAGDDAEMSMERVRTFICVLYDK